MATQKSTQPAPSASVTDSAIEGTDRPNDDLGGYQRDQVKTVFERIAVQSEMLRDFLQRLASQQHGHDSELRLDLQMAQSLATLIGAVADQMIGGDHIGSVGSWATHDGIEVER